MLQQRLNLPREMVITPKAATSRFYPVGSQGREMPSADALRAAAERASAGYPSSSPLEGGATSDTEGGPLKRGREGEPGDQTLAKRHQGQVKRSTGHTHRQRTTPPTHTRTRQEQHPTPPNEHPHKHFTTLEGGATTVRATSHARVGGRAEVSVGGRVEVRRGL